MLQFIHIVFFKTYPDSISIELGSERGRKRGERGRFTGPLPDYDLSLGIGIREMTPGEMEEVRERRARKEAEAPSD